MHMLLCSMLLLSTLVRADLDMDCFPQLNCQGQSGSTIGASGHGNGVVIDCKSVFVRRAGGLGQGEGDCLASLVKPPLGCNSNGKTYRCAST